MIISTVLNWLIVASMAIIAIFIIRLWHPEPVSSMLEPGFLFGPLLVAVAYVFGIAAILVAASSIALLTRVAFTRIVHTIVSAAWVLFWLVTMAGAYELLTTVLTLGVAASTVLIWLPPSRPFFCRTLQPRGSV